MQHDQVPRDVLRVCIYLPSFHSSLPHPLSISLELYQILPSLSLLLLAKRIIRLLPKATSKSTRHASWASRGRDLMICGVRCLRHARELVMQEGIVPRVLIMDSAQSSTSTVNERPWCSVLRGDTQVASVAEGVEAVATPSQ